MSIHQFTIRLQPAGDDERWSPQSATAQQWHGLLFRTLLPAVSPEQTTWLHNHDAPKPFALVPLFGRKKSPGLRVSVWDNRAADLLMSGWQKAYETGMVCAVGQQSARIAEINHASPVDFATLMNQRLRSTVRLNFLTPTAFRLGPINAHLTLPIPANVFARPLAVWQAFAPPSLRIPDNWRDWCGRYVYVQRHRIQTQQAQINRRGRIDGFAGWVQFATADDDKTQRKIWQALGSFAAYCGVGHKTTMGLGAVERAAR
ncbi:MAG: CRISPR system precrRNA processing endoribonuclease RAMP protein Cas6 [Chloroflexi bacterium]|nr:CRISPR system precrRNA processing endoribonuclease RAMP protein Cas6 [Chloroflexota bacterium]